MKFSEQWLREWVNPAISTEELAEQLTLMGLEVDEVESVAPGFSKVVVGAITDVQPHPDADKLRVCAVDAGSEGQFSVVCGAPNARPGIHVPFAMIGARLPGGHKIKKSKLRGVQSEGMLCSASELELSDDSDGLMELSGEPETGMDLSELLDLNDNVIEVELTPNRGDCLSIRGVARDVCARNDRDLELHEITSVPAEHQDTQHFTVSEDCACVHYTGRLIHDVDSKAPTPLWMVERLRRGGVRSINAAVDVTNYVMLELGQPMHAFDVDKVQGSISVRRATEGEKVKLLDGRDLSLESDTTVIADDRGAIGVAGIMGGDSTGVDASTRTVFLESALFLPQDIIGKPRRYDAHTDSAHRFERGVDPGLQIEALEYATSLLINIAGGKGGPVSVWIDEDRMPLGEPLILRRERIERVLGIEIADEQVESILTRLGVEVSSDAQGWEVTPPTYRYDLRIEEDYIEELARVHGFDRIPRTLNAYQPGFKPASESVVTVSALKNALVHRGFREVVTFSFVDDTVQQALHPEVDALLLANPISSDLAAMRCSLVPGLLSVMQKNTSRQNNDLRIFEAGLRFVPQKSELIQESVIGGLITGRRYNENWADSSEMADLFDLKGDLEVLLGLANANQFEFVPGTQPFLHPGRSADIVCCDENVGWYGELHPKLQNSLDLSQNSLLFEIRLDALMNRMVPAYQEISRYPSVRRDLSLLMPQQTTHRALEDCLVKHAPKWLQKIVTFDVYSGENIDKGMKSVALGLILQDFSRTLEEAEVDDAVAVVIRGLDQDLGVRLRA